MKWKGRVSFNMEERKLKDNIELLEIKLNHMKNDYLITRQEYDESTKKYLDIVMELREKNEQLIEFRKNLEILVKERTGDLKKSERKLIDINEELQIIFNSSNEIIYYKNINDKFVRVNKTFAQLLKLNENKIVGKKCIDVLQDYPKKLSSNENQVINNGIPKLLKEIKFHTPEGINWFNIDLVPYFDQNEKIIGVIGFGVDITQNKKSEIENKLLQEQVFQSQKLESIGLLAGGIAHDFNNILTVIGGYAELLNMEYENLSTSAAKAVKAITGSTKRAAKLTQQLLGFARKGKYNPVTVNINEHLKQALSVSEKILSKKIKVTFNFFKGINKIMVDKNQMSQVITNLIINANDAISGHGEINIKTGNLIIHKNNKKNYPTLTEGNYIKMSISDTGTGIPDNIKEKVLDPFFTTKKAQGRTGLGLATVYGIIQNHNGALDIESKDGKGTKVEIVLPESKKIIKEKKYTAKKFKATATILAIDDEEHIRLLAKDLFQRIGYKVYTAEDGKKGVELYKKHKNKIDIILLDMIMPEMDGSETFYALQKINPDVKVFIISGYIQDNKANDLLNSGALGFLQKPFDLKDAVQCISNALKNN